MYLNILKSCNLVAIAHNESKEQYKVYMPKELPPTNEA